MAGLKRGGDFQQQLETFSAEFRASLPEKIARIENLWAGVSGKAAQPARIRELKLALHSLAGSAGTFGVPRLSEVARTAELAVEHHRTTPAEVFLATMQQSLKLMRDCIDHEEPKARETA